MNNKSFNMGSLMYLLLILLTFVTNTALANDDVDSEGKKVIVNIDSSSDNLKASLEDLSSGYLVDCYKNEKKYYLFTNCDSITIINTVPKGKEKKLLKYGIREILDKDVLCEFKENKEIEIKSDKTHVLFKKLTSGCTWDWQNFDFQILIKNKNKKYDFKNIMDGDSTNLEFCANDTCVLTINRHCRALIKSAKLNNKEILSRSEPNGNIIETGKEVKSGIFFIPENSDNTTLEITIGFFENGKIVDKKAKFNLKINTQEPLVFDWLKFVLILIIIIILILLGFILRKRQSFNNFPSLIKHLKEKVRNSKKSDDNREQNQPTDNINNDDKSSEHQSNLTNITESENKDDAEKKFTYFAEVSDDIASHILFNFLQKHYHDKNSFKNASKDDLEKKLSKSWERIVRYKLKTEKNLDLENSYILDYIVSETNLSLLNEINNIFKEGGITTLDELYEQWKSEGVNEGCQQCNDNNTSTINNLQERLNEKDDECKTLKQQLHELQLTKTDDSSINLVLERLSEILHKLKSANYELQDNSLENVTEPVKMCDSIDYAITKGIKDSELQSILDKKEEEISNLQQQITSLSSELNSAKNTMSENSNIDEFKNEIEDLKMQIKEKTELIAKSKEKEEYLNSEKTSLKEKLDNLKLDAEKKIAKLKENNKDSIDKYIRENKDLRIQYKDMIDKRDKALSDAKSDHSKEIETLRSKYDNELKNLRDAQINQSKNHEIEIENIKKCHCAELSEKEDAYEKEICKIHESCKAEISQQADRNNRIVESLNLKVDALKKDMFLDKNVFLSDCALYIQNISEMFDKIYTSTCVVSGNNSQYSNIVLKASTSFKKFKDKFDESNTSDKWGGDNMRIRDIQKDLQAFIVTGMSNSGWVNIISYLNAYAGATVILNNNLNSNGLSTMDLGRLIAVIHKLLGLSDVEIIVPHLLVDKFDEKYFEYDNADQWISKFSKELRAKDFEHLVFDMSCIGYCIGNGEIVKPKVYSC